MRAARRIWRQKPFGDANLRGMAFAFFAAGGDPSINWLPYFVSIYSVAQLTDAPILLLSTRSFP